MTIMKQTIIKKNNNRYLFKGWDRPSLAEFLADDIGTRYLNNKEKLITSMINGISFDLYSIEKKGNNLFFQYEFENRFNTENGFTLSPEQLVHILNKWWEITEAGYEEIIITEHDDGSYTLEGRNPEPIKKEKKKSLFQKIIHRIFRN